MVVETEEIQQVDIEIPEPHEGGQMEFVGCTAKRQMAKCGRRWGKTYAVSIKADIGILGICPVCAGEGCLECDNTGKVRKKRVLYAAPTVEQVDAFWYQVCDTLMPLIKAGVLRKNETEHIIEEPGTEIRIKAKTAWNASTLRGDWGDLIILEEYQLWNEDAWSDVVQPMLLDTDGTAVFIFTPPSLKSEGVSKAKDPRHASKMFKKAEKDTTGRWKTFHFTSFDNPNLNQTALRELMESGDMSQDSYRREIMAEDDEIESSWLVYNMFNEKKNKISRFEIPKTWPVLSGHDFGAANPAALFVARAQLPLPDGAPETLRYGDYIVFKEYLPGAGKSMAQHIDAFKEITKDRRVEISVGGNLTTEEEIRQGYGRSGWPITAPLLGKVNSQIDRVKLLFEQGKIYIFDDLFHLLMDLANCLWELDDENKPKDKIKDEHKYHLPAALRYLATYLPVERPALAERLIRKVKVW